MKKLVSLIFVAAAFSLSANAQSILDKLGSLGNVISNAAGVVYSAPISLNGTYTYNGIEYKENYQSSNYQVGDKFSIFLKYNYGKRK